jgi:para-aminobenzoate synthetase/4-amino-4-deoxychorismate lyase
MNSFALLDDRDGASRLYTCHLATLACADAAALPGVLEKMQAALALGQHAVGLFSYELGAHMQGIEAREGEALSQVLLFAQCEHLSAQQVADWLAQSSDRTPAGIAQLRSDVNECAFNAAIARIHDWIAAGDTYQINYTYRISFDAFGGIHALYARLRERQPVPYGALIALPDGRAVLSLSPELFVRHEQGVLTARPMKGTAAASGDAAQDAIIAARLAADPKSRAENLMIVDLLRNDLGRIARVGSVSVPALFEVSPYSAVLQMTSTVQATLRDDLSLHEVFAALYPCGSITGAPKRRTMQIIRELEPAARGYYTGAIGWFDAPQQGAAIGDFCLSVPIRTLTLQAPDAGGLRAGEMGVGAGIVHDSVAQEEYAECALKARFLTGLPQQFELFETMHATRQHGVALLDRHLQRMRSSAAYFGMPFSEADARGLVQDACAKLAPQGAHRLRLALDRHGMQLQGGVLAALPATVRVQVEPEIMQSEGLFLRHKTSVRARYDAAWRAAEAAGAFDRLFVNERGELTEGGRSNVFLKLDGRWFTPPLSAGVLPGVMRAVLLADPAWDAQERVLTLDDLWAAEAVVVCNALRGVLPVTVSRD